MILDEILKYIQKTNPEMTIDKLKNELFKSITSTQALILTVESKGKDK